MKFTFGGLSDTGMVRKGNEDSFKLDEELNLLVVADGMGGHAAGEVASQMASEVIREQVGNGLRTGHIPSFGEKPLHLSDRAHLLSAALQMANNVVYTASQQNAQQRGMGTTVVSVLLDKKKAAVAHVGDSRVYLFRQGELRQVTQDHSVVAEQVAKGMMSQEEAEKSNIKNVLTRALGIGPDVEVDVSEYDLMPGDALLLCSDGLHGMVDDATIQKELATGDDVITLCKRLVEMANQNGGKDNVTVAIARAEASGLWEKIKGLIPSGA